MKIGLLLVALMAWMARAELKNGTAFDDLSQMPEEIIVQRRVGEPVRFSLLESSSAGHGWRFEANTNECELVVERRPELSKVIGDEAVHVDITVTSRIYTPARVMLHYQPLGQAETKPEKTVRLIVYTVGEAKDPCYPRTAVNRLLADVCAKRGITLTDWHLHIRGGMTVEKAVHRERDFIVRSSAMENYGREWEIYDNARLREFAARTRQANPKMPIGIQVNDRDWFMRLDADTWAQFDYILADTMIMGKLPSGRDNRLWMVTEIPDADAWMEQYFKHVMAVLNEPISIYANATYLPTPIAADYDRLWTEERMRAVIAQCVKRGIAIEIQAESPFPRPQFLKLAKEMGARFSFGTNNFDPGPKDLSRWLEVITWLDLGPADVWTPQVQAR